MNAAVNPYEAPGVTPPIKAPRPSFVRVLFPSLAIIAGLGVLATIVDSNESIVSRHFVLSFVSNGGINGGIILLAGMSAYFWTARRIDFVGADFNGENTPALIFLRTAFIGAFGTAMSFAVGSIFAIVLTDMTYSKPGSSVASTWPHDLRYGLVISMFYAIVYTALIKVIFRDSYVLLVLGIVFLGALAALGILLVIKFAAPTGATFCTVPTILYAVTTHAHCFAWWLSDKRLKTKTHEEQSVDPNFQSP